MFPVVPFADLPDGGMRHAVEDREVGIAPIRLTYGDHILLRQSVPSVPAPAMGSTPPTLPNGVPGVLSGGSKKEMGRIHARRVVATVKHAGSMRTLADRNLSECQLPRDAMRSHVFTVEPEVAVPFGRMGGRPRPTGIRTFASVDLRPESYVLWRYRMSSSHRGISSTRTVRGEGGVCALPTPRFYHRVGA